MFTFLCQTCAATFHSAARQPVSMDCQHCGGDLQIVEDAPAMGPMLADLRPVQASRAASES